MTKTEVLAEIDKKIEIYQHRIDVRKNKPCFFDETQNINRFIVEIQILKESKEWINKID